MDNPAPPQFLLPSRVGRNSKTHHLVYLVDASASITPEQVFKDFCTSVFALIENQKREIKEDLAFVSILAFSTTVKPYLFGEPIQNYDEIKTAIDTMRGEQEKQGTNTKGAMLEAHNLFTQFNNYFPGVHNTLVILTDGQPDQAPTQEFQLLRASKVQIFGIGINMQKNSKAWNDLYAICTLEPVIFGSFDVLEAFRNLNVIGRAEEQCQDLMRSLKLTTHTTEVSSEKSLHLEVSVENSLPVDSKPLKLTLRPITQPDKDDEWFFAPLDIEFPSLQKDEKQTKQITLKHLGLPSSKFPLRLQFSIYLNGESEPLPLQYLIDFPSHHLKDMVFSPPRKILLLGAQRSGKSAFINGMYSLSDPGHRVVVKAAVGAGNTHVTREFKDYFVKDLNLQVYDLWGIQEDKIPLKEFLLGKVELDTTLEELDGKMEEIKQSRLRKNAIDLVIFVVAYGNLNENRDDGGNQVIINMLKELRRPIDGKTVPFLVVVTHADLIRVPFRLARKKAIDFFELAGTEQFFFHKNYAEDPTRDPLIDASTRSILFAAHDLLRNSTPRFPMLNFYIGPKLNQISFPEKASTIKDLIEALLSSAALLKSPVGSFVKVGKKEGTASVEFFTVDDYPLPYAKFWQNHPALAVQFSKNAPQTPFWKVVAEGKFELVLYAEITEEDWFAECQ